MEKHFEWPNELQCYIMRKTFHKFTSVTNLLPLNINKILKGFCTFLTANRQRINRQKVEDDENPRNASGKLLDFGDGKVLFCLRVGTSTVDEYNQKEREEANLESFFSLHFTFLFLDRNLPREYNTSNREKPEYMQMFLVPKRVFEKSPP